MNKNQNMNNNLIKTCVISCKYVFLFRKLNYPKFQLFFEKYTKE